jgi:hypothetical protein
VAESPKAAFAAEVVSPAFAADIVSPVNSIESSETQFEKQPCGGWRLSLVAPEGTSSVADVELDIGNDQLRIKFVGSSPRLFTWPAEVGAAETDACSARFSKRRCELSISLPASAESKAVRLGHALEKPRGHLAEAPSPVKNTVLSESEPLTSAIPSRDQAQEEPSKEGGSRAVLGAVAKAASEVASQCRKAKPAQPREEVDSEALHMAGTWMLHSAASIGDTQRLQALLSAGVDANAPDDSGVCPLEKACIGAHEEAVSILLTRGANPNGIPSSPSTPLHRAVATGARGRKLVQLLCAQGAKRAAKDKAGRKPADLARSMGVEPFPELL